MKKVNKYIGSGREFTAFSRAQIDQIFAKNVEWPFDIQPADTTECAIQFFDMQGSKVNELLKIFPLIKKPTDWDARLAGRDSIEAAIAKICERKEAQIAFILRQLLQA